LMPLRTAIIEAFNDRGHPAMHTLAHVSQALAVLSKGGPMGAFRIDRTMPRDDFDAYFELCVSSHDSRVLGRFLRKYRRFVFSGDLPEGSWSGVDAHLSFDPQWRDHLSTTEAPLNGLIARYLAHRFFDAFDPSRDNAMLSFRYGSIAHGLAAAFRITLGISKWLDRPVDRATLKVAIGAAEFFFRNMPPLRDGMPWFGFDSEGVD
jgi:hypothetical protein